MKVWKIIFSGFCFVAIFVNGTKIGEKSSTLREKEEDIAVEPKHEYETLLRDNVENYYIVPNTRRSRNYSDIEIKILREKQSFKSDGSYICTPGRVIED